MVKSLHRRIAMWLVLSVHLLAVLSVPAKTVLDEIRPIWELAANGGSRKVSQKRPLLVPHTAIPNAKAFTIRARVRFGAVEEGHALMLFDQLLGETGFGFELIRQNSWGNPAFLYVNGEKYYSTYPVGRIKSYSTHEFTITARRGWIVTYLDGNKLQGFIMNATPNLEPVRVPGVIRPRWDTRKPWLELPDVELLDLKVWGDDVEYYAEGEPLDAPTGFKGGCGWLVEVPTHPIAGKPNVLCIGDSISDGYAPWIRKVTEGTANIYHFNTCFTQPGKEGIAPYFHRWHEVGALAQFDHVVVNNGLHSLHWTTDKVADAQVLDSYRSLFDIARAACPHARIHCLLTTPVTMPRAQDGKVAGLDGKNATVLRLNRFAIQAMMEKGADVIDLYSVMAEHLDLARGDQYHWTREGSLLIAKTIAEHLGIRGEKDLPK